MDKAWRAARRRVWSLGPRGQGLAGRAPACLVTGSVWTRPGGPCAGVFGRWLCLSPFMQPLTCRPKARFPLSQSNVATRTVFRFQGGTSHFIVCEPAWKRADHGRQSHVFTGGTTAASGTSGPPQMRPPEGDPRSWPGAGWSGQQDNQQHLCTAAQPSAPWLTGSPGESPGHSPFPEDLPSHAVPR